MFLGYVLGLEGLLPLGSLLKSTQPGPKLNVTIFMKPFPPAALEVLAPSIEVLWHISLLPCFMLIYENLDTMKP